MWNFSHISNEATWNSFSRLTRAISTLTTFFPPLAFFFFCALGRNVRIFYSELAERLVLAEEESKASRAIKGTPPMDIVTINRLLTKQNPEHFKTFVTKFDSTELEDVNSSVWCTHLRCRYFSSKHLINIIEMLLNTMFDIKSFFSYTDVVSYLIGNLG